MRARLLAALLVGSAACSEEALEPITVSSVTVTPATAQLASGAQLQFQAQVTGSNGATLTDRTVVWSSSDPALAQVTNTGLVTGGENRGATNSAISITASAEGVSGTAALDLEPVPASAVRLSADSVMLLTGDSVVLTASVVGQGDIELSGRDIVWSSLDSTVAQVTSAGVVRIVDDGGPRFRSAQIVARSEELADTAKIVAKPRPPAVQLAVADTFIRVGNGTRIEWEADRAVECTGSGLIEGSDGVDGALDYRPSEGGRPWAWLECTNDGGFGRDSVQIITPFPVLPTSYENFREYVVPAVDSPHQIIPRCRRGDYQEIAVNSRSYADYRQDGTITLADMVPGPESPRHAGPGVLCFWERTPDGEWVTFTEEMIDHDIGCAGGGYKGVVADYNLDQRPDVFFTCVGIKVDENGENLGAFMEGGESVLMLSAPEGQYITRPMGFKAWAHAASAGDIDRDGDPDLAFANGVPVYDPATGEFVEPFLTIFLNDGAGNLERRDDLVELPEWMEQHGNRINTLELMDLDDDGWLDIVYKDPYPTTILWNDQGAFTNKRPPLQLQLDQPEINQNGAISFTKLGRYFYSWNMPQAPPGEYPTGNTLQRFEIGTWKSEIIWEGYGPYWVDGRSFTNWGQIRYHNGKFMHDWVPDLLIDP